MDKVKNRMRELEQENKELQQLASNLRNTLHDAIQQQKQVFYDEVEWRMMMMMMIVAAVK